MTDTGKSSSTAQNKLGQLYVDLGLGGLGGMLNGLNKVSAQFLLTKNAAVQMVKPILNAADNAGKSAVGFKKMALALGTSETQIQAMHYWLKKHSLSDVIITDLGKMATAYQNFINGMEQLPSGYVTEMNRLGLDPMSYGADFESMLRLMEDVRQKYKQLGLTAAEQRASLGNLTFSEDFIYAFHKLGTSSFSDMPKLLDPNEVDRLIKAEEAINEAKINLEQNFAKTIADNADKIVKAIELFSIAVDKAFGLFSWLMTQGDKWGLHRKNSELFREKKINYDKYIQNNKAINAGKGIQYTSLLPTQNDNPTVLSNNSTIASIPSPISMPIPSAGNIDNSTYNNNMVINQNITSTDPKATAKMSSELIAQAERNAFENYNLTGV